MTSVCVSQAQVALHRIGVCNVTSMHKCSAPCPWMYETGGSEAHPRLCHSYVLIQNICDGTLPTLPHAHKSRQGKALIRQTPAWQSTKLCPGQENTVLLRLLCRLLWVRHCCTTKYDPRWHASPLGQMNSWLSAHLRLTPCTELVYSTCSCYAPVPSP